jgi:hypothetical protein
MDSMIVCELCASWWSRFSLRHLNGTASIANLRSTSVCGKDKGVSVGAM